MRYLLFFQKTTTIIFVISYLLGAFFLLKSLTGMNIEVEDSILNCLMGVTCYVISLLFFYFILNQAGRFLQEYQKICIFFYVAFSCVIPTAYLVIIYKKLPFIGLADLILLVASMIQVSVMLAILIVCGVRKEKSENAQYTHTASNT